MWSAPASRQIFCQAVNSQPNEGWRLSAPPQVEWAMGAVRLQFVVLDEIDTGVAQGGDQIRGLRRIKTDARLDDGADQRPVADVRQPAGSGDPEFRAAVARGESGRQAQ